MISIKKMIEIALEMSGENSISNDSYILCDYMEREVEHILAGIDMSSPEIVLANLIGADCVVGHHPAGGIAIKNMHIDINYQLEKIKKITTLSNDITDEISKIKLSHIDDYYGFNYYRAISAANILKIPFITLHTTIDIIGEKFIEKNISKVTTQTSSIGQLIAHLSTIKEISKSIESPKIVLGNEKNKVGRIMTIFTATASPELFELYFNIGIDTIICMYVSSNFEINGNYLGKNIIATGHMGGDSIGMNLFLDEIKKDYSIKITKISGLLE